MRALVNTVNPLIQLWSAVYVSALLSIYTYFAGVLAHNQDTVKSPAKTIRSDRGNKP